MDRTRRKNFVVSQGFLVISEDNGFVFFAISQQLFEGGNVELLENTQPNFVDGSCAMHAPCNTLGGTIIVIFRLVVDSNGFFVKVEQFVVVDQSLGGGTAMANFRDGG